nr:retrotransposon protein, putative, Ty1-copia subclass [Tanacetum cinerariifolium]
MASMNTRLNMEKLDGNIIQKHGGSKQVGLKQLGSKQVGFKQLGVKQVGFKQLGPSVEIGVHRVQDEKCVWFEVELQGVQGDRKADFFGQYKLVQMPLDRHYKLSLKDYPIWDCDVERTSKVPYANTVGSLIYLMVYTRPDIAYAVSIVSRYLANPGKNHWEAVKWILKYLRGTANVGLIYGKNHGNHKDVIGFVDLDYAKDPDKGRSITGYAFLVQGCVVSWKVTLQHVVALSTTEAEYMALYEGCEGSYLAKGTLGRVRTKHINVRYHFIREVLEAKTVEVLNVVLSVQGFLGRGSTDVGMLDGFDRGLQTYVQVFMDFDYAMCRSITRYGFMILGCAGSLKANLQHVEALSTIKAEYIALTEAVKEAIWLKGLLEELAVELNRVAVNCDNHGTIHLSWNHVFH